jgi:hypothetical protein
MPNFMFEITNRLVINQVHPNCWASIFFPNDN